MNNLGLTGVTIDDSDEELSINESIKKEKRIGDILQSPNKRNRKLNRRQGYLVEYDIDEYDSEISSDNDSSSEVEFISTSFDRKLEYQMQLKHGNWKLYHNLNERQKRTRLNILTSQIIGECLEKHDENNLSSAINKHVK